MLQATRPLRATALLLAMAAGVAGCADSTGPDGGGGDKIIGGINFTSLFALPSAAEVQGVRSEWAGRSPSAAEVRLEATSAFLLGDTPATLEVVSHVVDGQRHMGAIIIPNSVLGGGTARPAQSATIPAVVYHHGGDQGVNLIELQLLSTAMPDLGDQVVWVVPSYRNESLRLGPDRWDSEGPESPWDRDVDDAMALLSVALERTPAIDPERLAAVGLSRGGGVALLHSIRDPRIDVVVEFFGPTDFFDAWVQLIFEDIVVGRFDPNELPGVDYLAEEFVRPFAAGQISETAMRREMIRRSAVEFGVDIPALQLHHGVLDFVVPVSQAESLVARLQGLGRGEPDFQFYFYTNGRHDPFTLAGSVPRAESFLLEYLGIDTGSADRADPLAALRAPSVNPFERFPPATDPIWSWNR